MIPVTVAAALVIWFWALAPICFASYLTSPGASDADIIRQYWPHRVVEPEWVGATPDRLLNWHITETVARLAVVSVLWLLITGGVAYRLIRGDSPGGIEGPKRMSAARWRHHALPRCAGSKTWWLQRTARRAVPPAARGWESRAACAEEGCGLAKGQNEKWDSLPRLLQNHARVSTGGRGL